MKRYTLYCQFEENLKANETKKGQWVKYDDLKPLIEEALNYIGHNTNTQNLKAKQILKTIL